MSPFRRRTDPQPSIWLVSDNRSCILGVHATRDGARALAEEYFAAWRHGDYKPGSIRWQPDDCGDITDLESSYLEHLVATRPHGGELFPHWNICQRKVDA